MIISDLNFCEKIEFSNTIVGGATANTYGDAIAGPGYALGYVGADATGDSTYTNTQATTSVREKKYYTISKAKIKGVAKGKDANGKFAVSAIGDADAYVSFNLPKF